jgi:hypothetical protein
MINDFNIEFMVGDTVSFSPTFQLFTDNSIHNVGVISAIHGHQVWIRVATIEGDREYSLIVIRLSNEIKSVIKKAEVQLDLLD